MDVPTSPFCFTSAFEVLLLVVRLPHTSAYRAEAKQAEQRQFRTRLRQFAVLGVAVGSVVVGGRSVLVVRRGGGVLISSGSVLGRGGGSRAVALVVRCRRLGCVVLRHHLRRIRGARSAGAALWRVRLIRSGVRSAGRLARVGSRGRAATLLPAHRTGLVRGRGSAWRGRRSLILIGCAGVRVDGTGGAARA